MTDEDEQATDSVTPPDASLLLDDLDGEFAAFPIRTRIHMQRILPGFKRSGLGVAAFLLAGWLTR
ncbi:MAG: hypothetical protein ACI8TP_001266 [Acidimicrobiales bacterium]|jgi:hypothetical protein